MEFSLDAFSQFLGVLQNITMQHGDVQVFGVLEMAEEAVIEQFNARFARARQADRLYQSGGVVDAHQRADAQQAAQPRHRVANAPAFLQVLQRLHVHILHHPLFQVFQHGQDLGHGHSIIARACRGQHLPAQAHSWALAIHDRHRDFDQFSGFLCHVISTAHGAADGEHDDLVSTLGCCFFICLLEIHNAGL